MSNVAKGKRNVLLGHLVSQFAVNLDLIEPDFPDLEAAFSMQPLDINSLEHMRLVQQFPDGQVRFKTNREEESSSSAILDAIQTLVQQQKETNTLLGTLIQLLQNNQQS